MASQRAIEIKVGIFVSIALLVGAVSIFVIGAANQTFDKSVSLYTSFSSVSGLKMGSPVQLSGLKIGVVEHVWIVSKMFDVGKALKVFEDADKRKLKAQGGMEPPTSQGPTPTPRLGCHPPEFSKSELRKYVQEHKNKLPANTEVTTLELKVSFICVRMKIISSSLKHIRVFDSVALVKGKGLLGDSLIEISMGVKGPAAKEDSFIQGLTPKGLSDLMAEGGEVVTSLKRSLLRVEDMLTQYSDPSLSKNLKGIVASVNHVIGRVQTGPGLLHDLFYAKQLTANVKQAIFQLQRLVGNLANSITQINWILNQAKRRGTLVHSMLISRESGKFAKELQRLLVNTRKAVYSLSQILEAPQKPGTLLYKVLYEKETAQIATDLMVSVNNLRVIMDKIKQGKGSLGAVINDPTAFEDFKAILGQVKRSRVLRALIRFVIKRDESVKGGRIVKP